MQKFPSSILSSRQEDDNGFDSIVFRPVPTHFRSASDVNVENNNNASNDDIGNPIDNETATKATIFMSTSATKATNATASAKSIATAKNSDASSPMFSPPTTSSTTTTRHSSSPSYFSSSLFTPMNHKLSSFITPSTTNGNTRTTFTTNSKGGSFSIYKNKCSTNLHSTHFFHRHTTASTNSNSNSNNSNSNSNSNDSITSDTDMNYGTPMPATPANMNMNTNISQFRPASGMSNTNFNRHHYHPPTPIRASPFEPIVNDKQCGKISPLSMEEYEAWVAKRDYERQLQQQEYHQRNGDHHQDEYQPNQNENQHLYQGGQGGQHYQQQNQYPYQRSSSEPQEDENDRCYTFRPVVISPFADECINQTTTTNSNDMIRTATATPITGMTTCSNSRVCYMKSYTNNNNNVNDNGNYDDDSMSYSSSSYGKNDIDISLSFDDEYDSSSISSNSTSSASINRDMLLAEDECEGNDSINHNDNDNELAYDDNLKAELDMSMDRIPPCKPEEEEGSVNDNVNLKDEQLLLCTRMAGSSILSHRRQQLHHNTIDDREDGEEKVPSTIKSTTMMEGKKKRPGAEDKNSPIYNMPLKRSRLKRTFVNME